MIKFSDTVSYYSSRVRTHVSAECLCVVPAYHGRLSCSGTLICDGVGVNASRTTRLRDVVDGEVADTLVVVTLRAAGQNWLLREGKSSL
jgi:hypothetical protein